MPKQYEIQDREYDHPEKGKLYKKVIIYYDEFGNEETIMNFVNETETPIEPGYTKIVVPKWRLLP